MNANSTTTITPVVLCGGSGTRLWPLSRKSFPKQFVPLIGNKSLLQLTLERVSLLREPLQNPDNDTGLKDVEQA